MLYRGQYVYPPRPATAIKPFGPTYERFKSITDMIAQMKMNGQRNLIKLWPREDTWDITIWNRHHSIHLNYAAPSWLRAEVLSVLRPKIGHSYLWDSELLDAKHRSVKNTIYLYDLLVYDSDYLLMSSYKQRYDLMTSHLKADTAPRSDYAITLSDHVWMAFNIPPDQWDESWKRTDKYWDPKTKTGLVEGFVFKKLGGRLMPGLVEENNGDWLFRCRRESKVARQ